MAYPNQSHFPRPLEPSLNCDTRANFHDDTGAFMAQSMFSTNHHCLPNPSMFPEVYVTLISLWASRAWGGRSADPSRFDVDDDLAFFRGWNFGFNDFEVVRGVGKDCQVSF